MHRFSSNKPIISDERIASERIIVLRRIQKSFVIMLLSFLWFTPAHANDITITNVNLIPANEGAPDLIQFDIAWENSWRHPFSTGINNWDAAWVFIKFREVGNTGAAWSHLYLSNTPGEYATGTWGGDGPAGVVIDPALIDPRLDANGALLTPYTPAVSGNPAGRNPVVGAFIYRENVGRGRFAANGVSFAFNPAENGMDLQKLYDFKVFGIEMVYVPQGSFFAGSGGTETGRFKDGTTNNPFRIDAPWNAPNASGGRRIGNNDGQLWGITTATDTQGAINANIGPTSGDAPLTDTWPTGYNSFYSMKYSITQQQYVDFLNTLTYTQQNARINGSPNAAAGSFARNLNRHKIKIQTPGQDPGTPAIYETDHPFVANNWMGWMDGAAYADWSGLRPMTELEYEKAARGPVTTVVNEYAWGTASIATLPYTLSNPGEANETIATNYSLTAGNAMSIETQGDIDGPVRVGIFATSSSNRVQSGGSYYGVMELSGNVWERPITLGNATGRLFTGLHGDGALISNGNANVSEWPGTDAIGAGFRGGYWDFQFDRLRVSNRILAAGTFSAGDSNRGFRGVRSGGCFNDAAAPTFDTSVSPSVNANRWISGNSAANNAWQSVAYGNGQFVAVSNSGTGNRVMTSPDGITWTSRTSAANNAWKSVTYGNGLFVAVACGINATSCNIDPGNRVMTSPDGITWTSRTSAENNSWQSVTYGNGLFVAVSLDGTNRVMTSPDGINWTARPARSDVGGVNPWTSVTYGEVNGQGMFVAVSNANFERVMTSLDGITWTTPSSIPAGAWQSVTYGNGLFVAVAYVRPGVSSGGGLVMTSSDGDIWTSRNASAGVRWNSVTYGHGLFVAVAVTGSGNRVMTSTDGITWTRLNATAENAWTGVAFGDGHFVAVSSNGTGNRAMVFESLVGKVNRYKVNESGQFLWVVPNDWQIVGGQGTNELKSITTSVFPGTVRVAAVNECGAGTEAVYE